MNGGLIGIVKQRVLPAKDPLSRGLNLLKRRSTEEPLLFSSKGIELGIRGGELAIDRRGTRALLFCGSLTRIDSLRKELQEAGFSADGNSISRLLLQAYEHWETEFLNHLEGSFTLALFDRQHHRFLLARDPWGSLPLYWTLQQQTLLFATELKALLATDLVPQAPAPEALSAYLFLGYIPQDLSPIEGVQKLLPGYLLQLSFDGGLNVQPWWSPPPSLSPPSSLPELFEGVHSSLEKSLEEEECYLLTGSPGSRLLGEISRKRAPSIQAALIEYTPLNNPAMTNLVAFAEQCNTPLLSAALAPADLLNLAVPLCWHLDEPVGDPRVAGLWQLCSTHREKLSRLVVDSGASQSLFAPLHPAYEPQPMKKSRYHRFALTLFPLLRPIGRFFRGDLPFPYLHKLYVNPSLQHYAVQSSLFPKEELERLAPALFYSFDPEIFLQRLYSEEKEIPPEWSLAYLATKTLIPDLNHLMLDRITTAFGIEWRAPFLAHEMMQLVSGAGPLLFKGELRDYLTQQEWAAGVEETCKPLRLHTWLRDAALERAFHYLLTGTLVEAGWISRRWLEQALAGSSKQLNFRQAWALLQLEIWFRLFINGPLPTEPPESPLIPYLQ